MTKKPEQQLIYIAGRHSNGPLSRAQKQFNRLSKNIATERQRLSEWQEALPVYDRQVGEDYAPLLQRYYEVRKDMLSLLDRSYEKNALRSGERKKIRQIIGELGENLLREQDDEEIKALYNKYTDSDFDEEQRQADAEAGELMKAMMEGMFGIELGDDVDLSSPEKAEAAFRAQLELEQERERARNEQRQQTRKKTARQQEKEAQKRAEEQHVSKTIQEVFRKLAAALHPDREQDPAEQARKTELMQQVNVAYGKRNLLQLLELQLQVEQIDQSQLDNIAEDRLRRFNKLLTEQLAELRQEIAAIEESFRTRMDLPYSALLTPKRVLQELKKDTRDLRKTVSLLTDEIKVLQHFPALRAWLKAYKLPRKSRRDDFDGDYYDPFATPPF